MSFATRNTASVELCHARRGTANPTVHTEHALHPGSSLVGAGLGAERCQPTTVMGSVDALHLRGAGSLLGARRFRHWARRAPFPPIHPDERLNQTRP